MEEKTLLKISLVAIILGLSFLFIYSGELELKAVETLENIPNEETVRLTGKIAQLRETESAYFLKIEGSKIQTTDVILFPEEKLFLKEGQFVEVTGDTEEYKGKKEVIANKIIVK
ncbi:hypothetical protein HOD05_04115 [Candidatus Woesearchaeota archaeon]|jgi:RPA family protein|nr:hypothetical protein [Candidatus Woesearchaeota archaeon]MBT4151223.1 hypothetical protein [Candidatus Woesearchaeota archaeon]MBT4247655.1 hypothetical protein [Candidatus Woesearchaeota archaeon]MBT4434380.1 hypothetical protein [Candidatus Woesearchaeota archaeon]MBT7331743.1 hypothetical protein [Candidatus Woesearchaeota archaeon]